MKIGELIVELLVKGGNKAGEELGSAKKGMKDVTSSGLAAKAMIAGVIFGLQRLSQQSATAGTNLRNFSALTGMNTLALQKWQYVLRQVGVAEQSVANGAVELQQKLTQLMLTGEGAQGFQEFARATGFDLGKRDDINYVFGKLQQFAKMTQGQKGIGNLFLRGLIGDDLIAGFRQATMKITDVPIEAIYTADQQQRLQQVNANWGNFWARFNKIAGDFNAQSGGKIIELLNSILNLFTSITQNMGGIEALNGLLDKMVTLVKFLTPTETQNKALAGQVSGYSGGFFNPTADSPLMKIWDSFKNSPAPVSSIPFGSGGAKSTTNVINNYITTRDDPQSVGQAAANETKRTLQQYLNGQ